MSWKERQVEIGPALKTLKDMQRRFGKRGDRTHGETCLDRAAMIIALESGPCRDCQGLKITLYENIAGFESISLGCRFHRSPLFLHIPYVTQLGETPECLSQVLFKQEEESSTA